MDNLTREQRRMTMMRVRSQDTKPEMLLRRTIHAMGYRYRLYRKDLPGKPDLVFASRRKVIFLHGCFWHGHDCRPGAKVPASNQDYWLPKLARTRERDQENLALLNTLGWRVLVVWECELKDLKAVKTSVVSFLES